MTSDVEAMRKSVALRPWDDTARLALADAMEESGAKTWPHVIRTGVRQRPHTCGGHGFYSDCFGCTDRADQSVGLNQGWNFNRCPLKPEWEGEFAPFGNFVFFADPPSRTWEARSDRVPYPVDGWCVYRRGMVAEVWASWATLTEMADGGVFARWPVEHVWIGGKRPALFAPCGRFGWDFETPPIFPRPHDLPRDVWAELHGGEGAHRDRIDIDDYGLYKGETLAYRGAAAAMLRVLRRRAGVRVEGKPRAKRSD